MHPHLSILVAALWIAATLPLTPILRHLTESAGCSEYHLRQHLCRNAAIAWHRCNACLSFSCAIKHRGLTYTPLTFM